MSTLAEVLAAHELAPWSDNYDWYCAVECGANGSTRDGQTHAEHVAEAVEAAGLAVIQLPEPLWQTDKTVSWRVYLDGEPEDVYIRDGHITVSGIETFVATDVPALAAALLAAANAAEQVNA